MARPPLPGGRWVANDLAADGPRLWQSPARSRRRPPGHMKEARESPTTAALCAPTATSRT
eukprot:11226115-Lingulodinium_polyedra.AAC.1